MVERLLDGSVHPDDVPPGYRDVLRMLTAATAAPMADPAAEAAARAAFRSARRPADTSRRTSVLSKLLGVKALAAFALGAATIGTAAAATGTLPDAAQAAAHRAVAAVPSAEGAESGGERGTTPMAKASGTPAEAMSGLCRAYVSGRGGEQGGKLDATAFERLVKAAGGPDGVEAYCAALTKPGGSSTRAPQDAALAGHCRAWLAADRKDRTAELGKPVLDLLAKAAGGADAVAAYCTTLVGPSPADERPRASTGPHPTDEPRPASGAPESPGRDGHTGVPTPSRPAPPTPRG
jgi:hypothetical protein